MFEVNRMNPPDDHTDCSFVYRSVHRKARGTFKEGQVCSALSTRDIHPDRKYNLLPQHLLDLDVTYTPSLIH